MKRKIENGIKDKIKTIKLTHYLLSSEMVCIYSNISYKSQSIILNIEDASRNANSRSQVRTTATYNEGRTSIRSIPSIISIPSIERLMFEPKKIEIKHFGRKNANLEIPTKKAQKLLMFVRNNCITKDRIQQSHSLSKIPYAERKQNSLQYLLQISPGNKDNKDKLNNLLKSKLHLEESEGKFESSML